jgi:hypothetical protein
MKKAVAAALIMLAVAGCTSPPPPVAKAPPPRPPAVTLVDPATACLASLDQHHVVYERVPEWQSPDGCNIRTPVRVKSSETEWNRQALMSCGLAKTVWDFESEVVQPAAKALLGQGVRKMVNAGAYDCRGQRSDHPERMSEHAFGLAFDVTGFELDDGTKITVLHDWPGNGPKAEFLHRVATGACHLFNVVLTPKSNALHHDHLHLDIGPQKHCGA